MTVTYLCLPYMEKGSHIIPDGIGIGVCAAARICHLCGIKSLCAELFQSTAKPKCEKGITVTCVCPGPVDTAFEGAEKYP